MRERLQRRKKKTTDEPGPAAAPPPLQPAYFEEAQAPAEPDQPNEVEVEPSAESRPEDQPSGKAGTPEDSSASAVEAKNDTPRPARGRRRRGGRGRGGRGREQAVAQAFTPSAVKGTVTDEPTEGSLEAAPEAEAEPETASPEPQAPATPEGVPSAPARPPKGIVVLAIGLPGSGKSTWFKRHNVVPLSSDMVRSLLFDDIREQRFQDLVFSNLRSMLKARLIAKRPMNYVDATNLTPQERQHWIKLAKDYHYEVHAVFFDVPLEVCLERHQRRDRVVPEEVLRRMAAKLKPPSFDEGFAKITVVRVKKKE